jgi:hypothetical protein
MKRFAFLTPFALAGLLVACESDVDAPETVRLSVLLTDAPGDFSAAVVTISSIYLQGHATEDEPGGRVILRSEPVTTDLLTLANDFETLVDGVSVPEGLYGQLRFVIDGAYIVVETETGATVYATPDYDAAPAQVDGTLQCPSCAQAGIKVNFVGGLTLGVEDETILVDFDVSETFGHQAGNSGMWIMNPSLKAAAFEDAASIVVSLDLGAGVTLPLLGSALVTLADFRVELRGEDAEAAATGEIAAFTDANSDGQFEVSFSHVVPGNYVLVLHGPPGIFFGTSPALPMNVSIQSSASATADFIITSAATAN